MLESHTRQINTIDTTTIKRAWKDNEKKKRTTKRRQNGGAALGRPAMKLLGVGEGGGGGLQDHLILYPIQTALLYSKMGFPENTLFFIFLLQRN